jgi:hypothetical protein
LCMSFLKFPILTHICYLQENRIQYRPPVPGTRTLHEHSTQFRQCSNTHQMVLTQPHALLLCQDPIQNTHDCVCHLVTWLSSCLSVPALESCYLSPPSVLSGSMHHVLCPEVCFCRQGLGFLSPHFSHCAALDTGSTFCWLPLSSDRPQTMGFVFTCSEHFNLGTKTFSRFI